MFLNGAYLFICGLPSTLCAVSVIDLVCTSRFYIALGFLFLYASIDTEKILNSVISNEMATIIVVAKNKKRMLTLKSL